jgi:hypothetical protein
MRTVVPFNDCGLRSAASAALIGDPKARSADRAQRQSALRAGVSVNFRSSERPLIERDGQLGVSDGQHRRIRTNYAAGRSGAFSDDRPGAVAGVTVVGRNADATSPATPTTAKTVIARP